MTYDDEWAGLPYRPADDCPACQGAGFLHPRDGSWILYSRIVSCACLGGSVRVTDHTAAQTFETFVEVPGTEKALKAARQLASGEAKFLWYLLYGGTGNGKTHLARAIIRAVKDRKLEARMVLAADLFSQLREAMRDNRTDELLRRYKDVGFLAIDDYGVEYGSDWEAAKFDELMTSRYATAKPTVLVTNKNLEDLPPRVASRFRDSVMARAVHNGAPDFRPRLRGR